MHQVGDQTKDFHIIVNYLFQMNTMYSHKNALD